jgi:transcriptional regulator with XRE-family HTH domain
MEIVLHSTLKALMKKKGISARALCKELGIAQSTFQGLLDGKREPSVKHIPLLATYFGVSIDYLLTGSESGAAKVDSFLTEDIFEGLLQVKIARVISSKK